MQNCPFFFFLEVEEIYSHLRFSWFILSGPNSVLQRAPSGFLGLTYYAQMSPSCFWPDHRTQESNFFPILAGIFRRQVPQDSGVRQKWNRVLLEWDASCLRKSKIIRAWRIQKSCNLYEQLPCSSLPWCRALYRLWCLKNLQLVENDCVSLLTHVLLKKKP